MGSVGSAWLAALARIPRVQRVAPVCHMLSALKPHGLGMCVSGEVCLYVWKGSYATLTYDAILPSFLMTSMKCGPLVFAGSLQLPLSMGTRSRVFLN